MNRTNRIAALCVVVFMALGRLLVLAAETVLSFSGTASYVNLGTPDTLQFSDNAPLTVELWVYLNSVDSRDMLYCKNNSRSGGSYTHLFGFYDNGRMAAYTGSAWREPTPIVTVATKRWVHVAFSFDGTTMTYYIDGQSVGTSAFNYNNVAAHTVKLGGYDNNSSDINGMKSEVRVWDHARTGQQIADAMNIRLSGQEPGLLGYWRLNEGSGSEVLDYSLNNSKGTVINATWVEATDLSLALFVLSNPATGSRRFTNTNVVDVVEIKIPFDRSHYQTTFSTNPALLNAEDWISTNVPLESVIFPPPLGDTNLTVYAWFTNKSHAVELKRTDGAIRFTTNAPVLQAHATLERELVSGLSTVVLSLEEIAISIDGGTSGGQSMLVHETWIESPDDILPDQPEIVFATTGTHDVILRAVNEAGNEASVTCTVTVTEADALTGRTWTGLGGNALASTAGNWEPTGTPVTGENVLFTTNSSACIWDLDILLSSWTQTADYAGTVTFSTVYPGQGTFTNLLIGGAAILQGGTWTHPANSGGATEVERLSLTVAGDFTLGANAVINLDGKGYAANTGPGAGTSSWSGLSASHGGAGAHNPATSTTYGSITRPENLGSGAVRPGGGALRMTVGGTAAINGTVSAQGINTESGYDFPYCHGAGGSILITAHAFAGSGTIRAGIDISRAANYGSGGGRLALISGSATDFAGLALTANPHTKTLNGGGRAGTIYLETPTDKRLIIDQGNIGTASANHTDLPARLASDVPHLAYGGELEDVTLIVTNGGFAGLAHDLRIGAIDYLNGTLALNAWTLYVKEAEPVAFPGDYGNGAIMPSGVFYTFDNGDTVLRDGRLFWGDSNVTWRAVSLVYQNEGGTTLIDEAVSEAFYNPGSELSFAAIPAEGYEFIHWDGDVPVGTSSTNNPLVLAPLTDNLALRAWFRDVSLDYSTNTWLVPSSNDDWFDPLNWSLFAPPVAGQTVIIPSGVSLRLTSATPQLKRCEIAQSATLTVEGWESALQADDIVIAGTVTHLPQTVTEPDPVTGKWVPQHRILLQGSNLTLSASGSLNADYAGYTAQAGPGRAIHGPSWGAGGGGGYGGTGSSAFDGQMPGPVTGDPADPWQPGSGGGSGGSFAGGAIRVDMQGLVQVDGTLTACGRNGTYGANAPAGSGGGITIRCHAFQGAASGLIRADGGRAHHLGGCGGGGRIALHYDAATQAGLPRPSARFSAHAWQTANLAYPDENSWTVRAQMGTLFLTDFALLSETPQGDAVLDGQRFWHTRLVFGDAVMSWSPSSLTISNCVVGFPAGFELNVGSDLRLGAGGMINQLAGTLQGGLHLYAAATNTLYGTRLTVGRDLTIGSDSWLYPHTEGTSAAIVGMQVERNVTVGAGGGIDADEKGYMPKSGNGNGPGAGAGYERGGSYGGRGGGAVGGQTYGLATLPLEAGSPGAWMGRGNFTTSGKGGGAIHLLAGGNLQIEGLLSANGGMGWYYRGSAGSGGSIFLTGRRFSGSGTLQAKGGGRATGADTDGRNGTRRAPGGGGRIAVWHHLPLSVVQQRLAQKDVSGLFHGATVGGFSGALDASVTDSVLTVQAEEGSKGFYTLGHTLIILR